MNIISIDPSKNSTGIYCQIGPGCISHNVRFEKPVTTGYALNEIYNALMKITAGNDFDFAIIEQGFAGPGAHFVTRAAAIAELVMEQRGIRDIIYIAPAVWKKYALNIKHNKKIKSGATLYCEAVHSMYGNLFDSTDEADAFMMVRAVLEISKHPAGMTPGAEKIYNQLKEIIENGKQ